MSQKTPAEEGWRSYQSIYQINNDVLKITPKREYYDLRP